MEGRDEDVGTYTVRFLGFNNVYEVDQDSEIKEIPEIPQGYRDGGLDPETGFPFYIRESDGSTQWERPSFKKAARAVLAMNRLKKLGVHGGDNPTLSEPATTTATTTATTSIAAAAAAATTAATAAATEDAGEAGASSSMSPIERFRMRAKQIKSAVAVAKVTTSGDPGAIDAHHISMTGGRVSAHAREERQKEAAEAAARKQAEKVAEKEAKKRKSEAAAAEAAAAAAAAAAVVAAEAAAMEAERVAAVEVEERERARISAEQAGRLRRAARLARMPPEEREKIRRREIAREEERRWAAEDREAEEKMRRAKEGRQETADSQAAMEAAAKPGAEEAPMKTWTATTRVAPLASLPGGAFPPLSPKVAPQPSASVAEAEAPAGAAMERGTGTEVVMELQHAREIYEPGCGCAYSPWYAPFASCFSRTETLTTVGKVIEVEVPGRWPWKGGGRWRATIKSESFGKSVSAIRSISGGGGACFADDPLRLQAKKVPLPDTDHEDAKANAW